MEKEKLIPFVEMLNKAPENEREAIVAELAKKNNLKPKDMWKLLKDAGFGQKIGSQAAQQSGTEEKLFVILRHKTEYPKYRRAGLVLTAVAETYEVTEEQLAALKKDPWVIVGDGKNKKDDE